MAILLMSGLLGWGLPLAVAAPPAKGSISGTVTDIEGKPLESIGVSVSTLEGIPVGQPDFPATDAAGRYTVSGLAAGAYRVCFRANFTYSAECYDDQVIFGDSTPVTLKGAQKLRGINAVLDRLVPVSGRVAAPDGMPVSGARVWLLGTFLEATTDAQGRYSISDVPRGSYALCVVPQPGPLTERCWPDQSLEGLTTSLVVGKAPLTGVDVVLPTGAVVTGRLTDPGGAAVAAWVVVTPTWDWSNPVRVATTSAGDFRVEGLRAGAYTVCWEPTTSLLVQPGCWGPSEPNNPNSVTLSLGQVLDASATLREGGAITGKTVSASGTSWWGWAVYVNSEDWQVNRHVWLEPDGSYAVGGLPSGNYRVCGPNWVCLPDPVAVIEGVVTSGVDIAVP